MFKIRLTVTSRYGNMNVDSKVFNSLESLKHHIHHVLAKNKNIIKGKVYPIFQGNSIIMQCIFLNENLVNIFYSPLL